MKANTLDETQYWTLIKEIGSFNEKWSESVTTKSAIIIDLMQSLNPSSRSVLFASFNPIALHLAERYSVTVVGSSALSDIFDTSKIRLVDSIDDADKGYDIVLALDEYLTYGNSEQDQRDKLNQLSDRTKGWLITTLQDYKNFAPHKKNQIDAMSVNSNHNYIMLENSIVDKSDKQLWYHYWCCIKDHKDLITIGPNARRTMYFKQLAKYSSDAGSKQYVIQKNLLYKGFFSKNFEHIITVNFG
jgi:hypothetical protein